MDPRTFLKPDTKKLSPIPDIGAEAPALPRDLADVDRALILVFLRHVGCPMAEATFLEARDLAARRSELCVAVVSHGHPDQTKRWSEALGGSGDMTVLDDPDRDLYARYGLGLTSLGHFLGGASLKKVLTLAGRGIRNRHPSGNRWQQAGAFAIARNATIFARHIPAHAGDLPPIAAWADALDESVE